jgi:hypothetical protein
VCIVSLQDDYLDDFFVPFSLRAVNDGILSSERRNAVQNTDTAIVMLRGMQQYLVTNWF